LKSARYTTTLIIDIDSPENQVYNDSSVSIVFTMNKLVNWTGYSLEGQDNVTVIGNTTLVGLRNGSHKITVYANDTLGSTGKSEIITFTIVAPKPFPTALVATTSAASAGIIAVGLLVYFKKRKYQAK